jgi:polar amino acid transport system permease protein
MAFNLSVLINALPDLMDGLKVTVIASILAIIASVTWGILIGVVVYRNPKVIGPICKSYVIFFRETPLLVQLYFIFYGLAYLHLGLPAIAYGIIGLMLNDGAYIAEIVRGGLQGIDKGQWEASYSLGFSYTKTLWFFILPQAIRSVLDSILNMLSIIIKDTSLLMWITITELTYQAQMINIHQFDPVTAFLTAAVLYFILFLIVQGARKLLERKVEKRYDVTG